MTLLRSTLFLLSLSGLCLTIAAPPSLARAQAALELADPSAVPEEVEVPAVARRANEALVARMEEQLVQRAQSERVGGMVTGITGLALGALLVGSSIWLSVDDGAFGGGFGSPNPAAITGLAAAPILIASGIYSLVGIGTNGDRLARWRLAMSGELSPLELGRFEGELRAEANAARVSRWASFALGVGTLVSGAVTIVLGASLEGFDDGLRGILIGGGGGLAAIGGVLTGVSFIESSVEQAWNQYRQGDTSPTAGVTVQPVIGPGGIGLVGTF